MKSILWIDILMREWAIRGLGKGKRAIGEHGVLAALWNILRMAYLNR